VRVVTQDGMTSALFEPEDAGFVSADIARGPWDDRMMHGGAPSALLARAVEGARAGEAVSAPRAPAAEAAQPGDDLVVTRLSIDFLGGVPLGRVDVETTVVRPGRRFQLVDATLDAGGRRACLARAVRVRRADLPGAAASGPPTAATLPLPQEGDPLPMFVASERELFYPDATEIRQVAGELGSGAVAAWIRLRGELVRGEPPSQLARAAAAADFANGLSWILPWRQWLFVNTELTIHLHREPAGEWIGLDARTATSAAGFGLSTATLHDLDGPFGVCAQSLFVERR
jgi:acyl-coenzyme A thioesterase PaaI-like protein